MQNLTTHAKNSPETEVSINRLNTDFALPIKEAIDGFHRMLASGVDFVAPELKIAIMQKLDALQDSSVNRDALSIALELHRVPFALTDLMGDQEFQENRSMYRMHDKLSVEFSNSGESLVLSVGRNPSITLVFDTATGFARLDVCAGVNTIKLASSAGVIGPHWVDYNGRDTLDLDAAIESHRKGIISARGSYIPGG